MLEELDIVAIDMSKSYLAYLVLIYIYIYIYIYSYSTLTHINISNTAVYFYEILQEKF